MATRKSGRDRTRDQLVAAKVRWLSANEELFRVIKEMSDAMSAEPADTVDKLQAEITDLRRHALQLDRVKLQAVAAYSNYVDQAEKALQRRGSRRLHVVADRLREG